MFEGHQRCEAAILIDASNLHGGGGVQVAASFLDELAQLVEEKHESVHWINRLHVEASERVIVDLAATTLAALDPTVKNRRPTQFRYWLPVPLKFDVSFTIFGPEFGVSRARRRIVGFADVTSVCPRPMSLKTFKGWARYRHQLRGHISRSLHSRVDLVIVETQSLSDILDDQLSPAPPIKVVPNAVNGVFSQPNRWRPVKLPEPAEAPGTLLLSYVARAYPHKNHEILGDVWRLLADKYGISVKFVVTLNRNEWMNLSLLTRAACLNVGEVALGQVPSLLGLCHGAIFPSLLESSSITPLEVFTLGKILFASDRDFMRATCGEAPVYFDPLSAHDIAVQVSKTLRNSDAVQDHIREGLAIIRSSPTARDRALGYLESLRSEHAKISISENRHFRKTGVHE